MKTRINNIDFEATELLDSVSTHDQTYLAIGYCDKGNKYEAIASVSCGEIVEITEIKSL